MFGIDRNLSRLFKIHRYEFSGNRLNLPDPPFQLFRVADKITRYKNLVQFLQSREFGIKAPGRAGAGPSLGRVRFIQRIPVEQVP